MNLTNGLILLLLIAGHTELWVAWVNRVHGLRLSATALHRTRRLHDVVVPLFPLALLIFVGLTGPKVLLSGSWSDVGPLWRAYLFVCALGVVGLTYAVARWQFRVAPACLQSVRSTIVDYSQLPGGPPVGQGPYQKVAAIPGNQLLQLEISEKHFRLEAPETWKGAKPLSILHLTDWHFIGTPDLAYYQQLCVDAAKLNCDLIVFTGDLLDNIQLTKWIEPTLGQLSAPLGCYYILGNHDWPLDDQHIREQMTLAGWTCVAGSLAKIEHDGRTIALGGTEMPWMSPHPDFSSTSDSSLRILLSHYPDNLKWARDRNIDIMLAGHNHGGQVILPIIGPVYSPALSGVKYSNGEFFADPTLMHVSRGVSGHHPLRWNCRPEISRLVFEW